MRVHRTGIPVLIALALVTPGRGEEQPPQTSGRMGGYEVVPNWPQPLPDTDLSHDGWTWGSGSGVWAESPDKVWIAQRGEIELPPGAKPWTFAGLLTPPRGRKFHLILGPLP